MSFLWRSKPKAAKADKSTLQLPNGSAISLHETKSGNARSAYTLADFPRILERRFGESLGFRTRILRDLIDSERLGIGLPDLVHMTLHDSYHDLEVGEYFYITGVDVSSASMPIAFIKMLKLNEMSSPDSQIATYCCNNIFSKMDIRIRYETDGSAQVRAFDVVGNVVSDEITETQWEETFVSCCIRSLITSKENERKLPGMVEFPLAIENTSMSGAKRVIRHFCKFLPRCMESGWDTTRNVHPSVLHNYLMRSLLIFLAISPMLVDYALAILKELAQSDPKHELYYKVALIAILEQYDERDLDLVRTLNETLNPLLPLLDTLKPRDPASLQLLNCMSCLLNLQAKFLIRRGDSELALPVAKISTELALDSPESWYYLAKCYIDLGEYERALLAINAMPNLPSIDQDKHAIYSEPQLYNYYARPLGSTSRTVGESILLDSNEFNNLGSTMKGWQDKELREVVYGRMVMPNKAQDGMIAHVWDKACAELGPIYGPQSCNLINFVSPQEVQSIEQTRLLARNTVARQYSWFQRKAVQLLMELVQKVDWNNLLQLRTKVFVMEAEYVEKSGATLGMRNSDIPLTVRRKRICERWLDQLFLDIYEDLELSQSAVLEDSDAKYSGLEWELMGLTMVRACSWSDAIACLRTSTTIRFDWVSCRALLELFLDCNPEGAEVIDLDLVVELVAQKISYEKRFYDSFQVFNLQVLFKLAAVLSVEGTRTRFRSLPYSTPSFVSAVDRMLDWVDLMTRDALQLH